MITKHEIQTIRSLSHKKCRDEENVFVAEGIKVIEELLPLIQLRRLFVTEAGQTELQRRQFCSEAVLQKLCCVTEKEMERISFLKTPRNMLALFEKPQISSSVEDLAQLTRQELCLALDSVQDPGNVGTILRIADWFGIEHIFASPETADVFAPKVVQATMGAIGRVKVHYIRLTDLLSATGASVPVYGTFLDGENIYKKDLSRSGVIVMGNEGNGISAEVGEKINQRLFIPNYPAERATSESLNVAVATSIVCAEFRRRMTS